MKYFNLILTNHAIERIKERGLTRELAWETFNKPTRTYQKDNGSTAYEKDYKTFKTTLIAKRNEKGE